MHRAFILETDAFSAGGAGYYVPMASTVSSHFCSEVLFSEDLHSDNRLGDLIRDLSSMAVSLILASNETFMAILVLGLLACGLYWWRAF
jgi:hypothetical protein